MNKPIAVFLNGSLIHPNQYKLDGEEVTFDFATVSAAGRPDEVAFHHEDGTYSYHVVIVDSRAGQAAKLKAA